MNLNPQELDTVIIGAGPAGLSASYSLAKANKSCAVLEIDPKYVGGLSRTVKYKDFYFDIGGHRFFTKQKRVQDFWNEILPDDFSERNRLSRIYYKKKFLSYPLKGFEALAKTGVSESVGFVTSFLKAKLTPIKKPISFEDWAINQFGQKLYEAFFKSYTEKVWGRPCGEISREWADQRIQSLSLGKAIKSAFINGAKEHKTLIDRFHYPSLGPGLMWEECVKKAENLGTQITMGAKVTSCLYKDGKWQVQYIKDNQEISLTANNLISTIPITKLMELLHVDQTLEVVQKALNLKYRGLITVALMYKDMNKSFPDNWIYVHDKSLKVGRIQNFKRWSEKMVPDINSVCLGLEYFCEEGGDLWSLSDDELSNLGKRELVELGLISNEDEILDFKIIKAPKAYPVYELDNMKTIDEVKTYLDNNFQNLYLSGRNGMHRYNNQDHSIMTSLLISDKIIGKTEALDHWNINANAEYIESE